MTLTVLDAIGTSLLGTPESILWVRFLTLLSVGVEGAILA